METCNLGLEGISGCLVFQFIDPTQSNGKKRWLCDLAFMSIIYRYPIRYFSLWHKIKFKKNICRGTCFDQWIWKCGIKALLFPSSLGAVTPWPPGSGRGAQYIQPGPGRLSLHLRWSHRTRRYNPMRGLSSSSCKGLWPSAESFFCTSGQKKNFMLFLGYFRSFLVFISNLSSF